MANADQRISQNIRIRLRRLTDTAASQTDGLPAATDAVDCPTTQPLSHVQSTGSGTSAVQSYDRCISWSDH